MTPWRRGYIDGLHGDTQRTEQHTAKALRQYNRGYSKGLYWLYLRMLRRKSL